MENNAELESLLGKARKGASAQEAMSHAGDYLWARLWKAVTSIANCPPDLNTLLMHRAEIKVIMLMCQEMQLNLADADIATAKLKELLTAKPKFVEMP